MAKLESFRGLTEKQENLLKKSYSYGSAGLFSLKINNGDFTYRTRFSERVDHPSLASAWIEYKNNLFSLKGKKANNGDSYYNVTVTPANLLKDLKLVFDCRLNKLEEKVDPSVAVEYKQPQVIGKLSYYTLQNVAQAQITLGKPELGLGFNFKFDVGSRSLKEHNTAVWWFKDASRVVFKYIGKKELLVPERFELSYYQEISSLANLGSKVTTNWSTKATEIEVGGDYKYDESTLLKAKINSFGSIGLALSRTLNPSLKATIATEVNAQSLISHNIKDYKLGVRLDFNS
jgi:Eukaryotic porin